MDHNFAIESHAAERYLMGDLNEIDRDAYEEHFFSCSACAEEIKLASDFMESARHVVQQELKAHAYKDGFRRMPWGNWLNWKGILQPMPAAACVLLVALAGFVGYQNSVIIPRLTRMAGAGQPQGTMMAQLVAPNHFLIRESRGAEINSVSVPKNRAFILQFDIADAGFDSYLAEIRDESNIKKMSAIVPKKDTASPVLFLVPADALKSGKYSLVIHGINRDGTETAAQGESARISFQLTIQD